jgi:cobalt-zinc-cadmium efflux system membrane fusion protein
MGWLQRNLAWLLLILVLGLIAGLYLTGRGEVHWYGGETRPLAERPAADKAREGQGHLHSGKVVLDEETLRSSGIRTAPVTAGAVAINLRLNGEVQLAEDRFAHVTPRLPGVVRVIHHTVGDAVSAGTPLCTLESVELGEARAAFVAAISETSLAERNYQRWRQLYKLGLKPQNEFWAAENQFTRARLSMEAAKNKLRALGLDTAEIEAIEEEGGRTVTNLYEVKSPITGTVLERHHVSLGEYLAPKDEIFLVADLSEVWVLAALYEKDLPAVRIGMRGVVHPQGFPEARFEGRVSYIGQQVEKKTRTVPLRLTVKNAPLPGSANPFALRPEMFTTIDLETSHKRGVPLIPLAAAQTVHGETVVFVPSALPEDVRAFDKQSVAFERRVVMLGMREGESVEVTQGLAAGEEVVVDNAYLLKSEFEKAKFVDDDGD